MEKYGFQKVLHDIRDTYIQGRDIHIRQVTTDRDVQKKFMSPQYQLSA